MKKITDEISIRPVEDGDAILLKKWLNDPKILCWFPMINEIEIDDSIRIWMSYSKMGAGITALYNGKPCGMFNLYIQPFKKIAHNSLFSIIVDEECRGRGVGKVLIEEGQKLAKDVFNISLLLLEVYEGNPARRLYERMGFSCYAEQKHYVKEDGKYLSKFFMQKKI
ncbi:MAG: GNAT family N-acetyltransferase [Chlamydiae bacterium]|nr:GNAT family N-acetyltransferase [Chlamydiota bacterium]